MKKDRREEGTEILLKYNKYFRLKKISENEFRTNSKFLVSKEDADKLRNIGWVMIDNYWCVRNE